MRNWWAFVVAALGAVLLTVFATTPPGPRATDTPAAEFSAVRAMNDVTEIGRAPHPAGSADNARVRAWLVTRLTGMGLSVRTATAPMSSKGAARLAKWSGDATVHPIVNIVATLPGRDRSLPALVLMAHYDSVWGSPGAADDGAGVASILEMVRALKASGPTLRDVMVVLTDGEELGLEGGKAFVAADPDRARAGVIINLETRGGGGRAAMFETGHDNGDQMQIYAGNVRRPSATSLSVFIYEHLPNSTDFTPAKQAGIAGFNFAFIGRPGLYHSPLATPANLDQGALQDMGAQSLDLARALANAAVLPGKAPNLVFFDVLGLFLIGYPPVVGWMVIGIGGVLLALAGWRVRASAGDIGRGALATVVTLALGGGLMFGFNLLSGSGAGHNYYDRLAAIPWLTVQATLLAVAATAVALTLRRRDGSPVASTIGTALPLLALGVALQATAPTAAFVVTWPVMFAGIIAAALAFLGPLGTAIAVATVALEAAYTLAFAFFLFEAVGPDQPYVAALPAAMVAMLAWPLVPPVAARQLLRLAVVLCLGAGAVALGVKLDPMAASVAVYSLKGAA